MPSSSQTILSPDCLRDHGEWTLLHHLYLGRLERAKTAGNLGLDSASQEEIELDYVETMSSRFDLNNPFARHLCDRCGCEYYIK